ncbi:CAP domain-containing protein [Deinococcus detaillensis]|uniref:CAP domain-containing protein n=1 Tax=Deinococcus detaillensis TaxID=2592048 RepID=A0A553UMI0_9DEIO|nr:CAP domain-containing protein [Deinococcus detaillensis]TSA81428.1 CAP domain-containing protein [Deinococcus detaillensis]
MFKSLLAVSLLLLLSACNSPGTPTSPKSEAAQPQQPNPDTRPPFDVTLTPEHLTLSNKQQGKVAFTLVWNSYKGMLWHVLQQSAAAALLKAEIHKDAVGTWISVDATDVLPGEYTLGLKVNDQDNVHSIIRTVRVTVAQDASLPSIAPINRVRLSPGQQVILPLTITPPANGTPLAPIIVSSPAPELLSATLVGSELTIRASAAALPQGLIPITVKVSAGAEAVSLRIPVEIGDLIEREYDRFNELRAQANLPAVTFDTGASMNCWMHGRYMMVNEIIGHNQNPALPFASLEGLACATSSNVAWSEVPLSKLSVLTPSTSTLFTAPFHALGMLQPTQQTVGIGVFTVASSYPNYARLGSAITSLGGEKPLAQQMTFPGDKATTDMSSYNGGEWPDPLTACPDLDPQKTGLPLIAATFISGATTATEATLASAGQDIPVCAYGSTQYANTKDKPGDYVGGPIGAQEMGRSILQRSGAVFMIPKRPLEGGKTYQASVKINGQLMQWSFMTAAALREQSLPDITRQQIR